MRDYYKKHKTFKLYLSNYLLKVKKKQLFCYKIVFTREYQKRKKPLK